MYIKKNEVNEAEKFIDSEFDRLISWLIGDIKRCCRLTEDGTCDTGGALVDAFILWIVAIDFFGGIFTNCVLQGETKRRFKEFVTKYMPQYDYEKLLDLRWSLLHFYTTRHYAFHQNNDIGMCRKVHLSSSSNGVVLDLSCAISDLENATEKYKADLHNSGELKVRLFRYFKVTNPLVPIKFEYR